MKRICVLMFLFVIVAGCGKDEKVGEAFEEFEGDKAGERLGSVENTPTPKPAGGADKPAPAPKPQAAKTPAPRGTPAPAQTVDVKITSSGFDPTALRVTHGATIKVTNADSAPHTYTALSGDEVAYDTGSLAAGASKSFVASKAGQFQVEDRTRNWIIGSLEVAAR